MVFYNNKHRISELKIIQVFTFFSFLILPIRLVQTSEKRAQACSANQQQSSFNSQGLWFPAQDTLSLDSDGIIQAHFSSTFHVEDTSPDLFNLWCPCLKLL